MERPNEHDPVDHAPVSRFQSLVERIPGIVAYLDRVFPDDPGHSTPLYISPQIEALMGYPREAWLNEDELWLQVLHPDDAERQAAQDEHARATLTPLFAEYRMIAKDGRTVWVSEKAQVVVDEATGVSYWQGVMVDITDRKQTEDELLHRTLHDSLTELPNRLYFYEAVTQAIAGAKGRGQLAILLIDLDRFKEINDTLGHHYGDLLLCEFAGALRSHLRPPDTLARLGGDEFALLLHVDGDAAAAATSALHRIEELVAQPYQIEGLPLSIEASIGVACFPSDGTDVDQLLQHADIAMYTAKRNGAGHAFYERSTNGTGDDRRRLGMLGELRRAIAERELVLHYQPKLDLRSKRIERVEALVRWQHPSDGLVPPVQFIPLAEQTGLIKPLTRYVLESALQQCRRWLDDGRSISISVNISPRNLNDCDFPEDVERLLRTYDVSPEHLLLEVTERGIIADPARAEATLRALSDLGVHIALDDFGAGHSSLSFLARLPLDQIKIDRSFVTDLDTNSGNDVIVRSIINLGHQLGLEVVGEGVETVEVETRLEAYGCDLVQGFKLTPALPPDELEEWLEQYAVPARA
jgi:diguanylate cyclase (GGDEF)-like protein/PAS domain S-box-containing protein